MKGEEENLTQHDLIDSLIYTNVLASALDVVFVGVPDRDHLFLFFFLVHAPASASSPCIPVAAGLGCASPDS